MKSSAMQIVSMLQAYSKDDVFDALEFYKKENSTKQKLLSEGWVPQHNKPDNVEFYKVGGEYWVQSVNSNHAKKNKRTKQRLTNKKKVSMALKRVGLKCPKCGYGMYKQSVCGGCSAGKAGYKIRLICEENPDHEFLL